METCAKLTWTSVPEKFSSTGATTDIHNPNCNPHGQSRSTGNFSTLLHISRTESKCSMAVDPGSEGCTPCHIG